MPDLRAWVHFLYSRDVLGCDAPVVRHERMVYVAEPEMPVREPAEPMAPFLVAFDMPVRRDRSGDDRRERGNDPDDAQEFDGAIGEDPFVGIESHCEDHVFQPLYNSGVMYSYGLLIEIEPGITRPAIACTVADLTAARQLEQRKIALYALVELLVADAARYGFELPPGLRERACECRGDLRELESVRSALEDALLTPA